MNSPNNTSVLSLIPYNLLRPEQLEWIFPKVKSEEEIFLNIKSKSLRTFLRKTDEILAKNKMTWEYKPLPYQNFLNWLPFYRAKMEENNFSVFANERWYEKMCRLDLSIHAIQVFQERTLVGTCVLSLDKRSSKATAHFKASERLKISQLPNASLGALVDFLFLRTMQRAGILQLSSGRARNAAGVFNTFGYIEYKLRFGFFPTLAPVYDLSEHVPTNESGTVLFFGLKNQVLLMVGVKKKENDFQFEAQKFATANLPFLLLEY